MLQGHGYFGSECKGINSTIDRAVRDYKLPLKSVTEI